MAFCVFAGIAVIVNEARGTPSLKATDPQRRVGPVVAMMEAEGEGPLEGVGPVVAVMEAEGEGPLRIGFESFLVASCNWSLAISGGAGLSVSGLASAWV